MVNFPLISQAPNHTLSNGWLLRQIAGGWWWYASIVKSIIDIIAVYKLKYIEIPRYYYNTPLNPINLKLYGFLAYSISLWIMMKRVCTPWESSSWQIALCRSVSSCSLCKSCQWPVLVAGAKWRKYITCLVVWYLKMLGNPFKTLSSVGESWWINISMKLCTCDSPSSRRTSTTWQWKVSVFTSKRFEMSDLHCQPWWQEGNLMWVFKPWKNNGK